MTTTLDVFISSKMVELKAERDALYALLPTLDYGDIKLRAWVFEEDAPASDKSIRDIYLKALQNSALYLGLFWNLYGEWTIDEFDRAMQWGMERHIYVKDVDADQRDPNLDTFLKQHGDVQTGITAKWFKTTEELCEAVKHSIEAWIVERLRSRPGGTSAILAQEPDDLTDRPRKLIGRDDLLHDISELLDNGERVLLQGFGGMGKTALAATAAGEWIRAGKGAVVWLKTGSASADALFEALARPFNGQQAIAGQQDEAKIQAVRQLLRGSGAKLLVLDDCWNGQSLFTVLKAVPSDMAVLATARQRFPLDNRLKDYSGAIEYYEQALAIACQIGDKHGEAHHLSNLGTTYANLGEYSRATEYQEQALVIFEAMGVLHLVESVKNNLAIARQKMTESGGNKGDNIL